jgi:cytidylate kinase
MERSPSSPLVRAPKRARGSRSGLARLRGTRGPREPVAPEWAKAGQGILRAVTIDPTPNPANSSPAPGPMPAPGPPRLVVAVDGPSSSGKSTVGAEAARRLGYRFCDTGLLYRAVAWLAVERGITPDQTAALVPLAQEVQLIADARGRLRYVEAAGRDVTAEVRGAAVDRAVSDYSKVPELRAALVPRQRALAADGGIIMAGRDIGTVILPNADMKIYLYASPEERARRRAAQRNVAADESEATGILEEMRRRDAIDSERETAPLRSAADAVVLKTDGNTFDQTVSTVVRAIRDAEAGGDGRGNRGR